MKREKPATKWIETGYVVFAHEGPEGIHIEKIARQVDLNKSSFYHYFGEEIHYGKISLKKFDPISSF